MKKIIGMIHLLPSIGYNQHQGFKITLEYALNDLEALVSGGISAVLVENDNDLPHQVKVDPEVISFMTIVIEKVVEASPVPVGVEVLLNDPKVSLAIANNTGCKFIRTDYFVDKMYREEYGGNMYINPIELIQYKNKINAQDIEIYADIQVKYAKLLEQNKSISMSTEQAIENNANAVIVTGSITGEKPLTEDVKEAKYISKGKVPIFVGSGFSIENALELLRFVDVAIVGTSIKESGFNSPVSKYKVKKLMDLVNTNFS